MAPPTGRRHIRQRTPPRRVFAGSVRKPVRKSMLSTMANSAQIDTLTKVQKLLEKKSEGEVEEVAVENPRDSRLKVAVRVRPMNPRETNSNARNVISVASPNMLVFDPKVEQQEFFFHNRRQIDVTAKKYKNQKFAFDHVYGMEADNVTIFSDVMKPLLTTLLSGFNCSVFAYGATGSGKTFTMLGNNENPGLTFLTMNELYKRLNDMQETYETQIVISYFEVYNEQVRDLLHPTGEQLQVREVGNGIDIANLSFHRPKDVHDLLEMLQRGNAHRSQHPTDHNAESSRSHALLQVHIHMRERFLSMDSNSKTAKLVMVDLAGSEKGAATGCTGQRFREGSSINRSLLALSNCISALARGRPYISFRDSKLTRILKDSLGGNCKTVMIANISPADTLYDDTLNTLRYAEKAKKISCNAKKNMMTVQSCLTQYTKVVEEMTTKIETLEERATERENFIQELAMEKVEKEKEIDKMKAQMENMTEEMEKLKNELKYYKLKQQDKLEPCDSSWLANPVNIPNLNTIVDKLNEHISAKEQIRPAVEGFIMEFKLKAKRYEELRSLAEATGDLRYRKASKNLRKKLKLMITEIDSALEKIGTKGFVPCLLNHRTTWESVVSPLNPNVQISSAQLYNSYVNEFKSTDLTGENALLRRQVKQLIKTCMGKEALLGNAAMVSNQMKNLLEHYKQLTPKLKDQYDEFVLKYSGTPPVVRFAGYESPRTPPILVADKEPKTTVDAKVLFENCELEDYYSDVLKRLSETSEEVGGKFYPKLINVVRKASKRTSSYKDVESLSSIDEALSSPEMSQSFTLDDDPLNFDFEHAEAEPPKASKAKAKERNILDVHLLPTLTDVDVDSSSDEEMAAPPSEIEVIDLTGGGDNPVKVQDIGNSTVTLAKNFEETFTKDEECVENQCPEDTRDPCLTARLPHPSGSFKLPTITEMVNEKPSTSTTSCAESALQSATEAAGSRERTVFVPIQLSKVSRASTQVTPGQVGVASVIVRDPTKSTPTPSHVKGTMKVSPRLKFRKGPVNNPQASSSSLGRGGGGPTGNAGKSRPYPLSRGFGGKHPPNNNNN